MKIALTLGGGGARGSAHLGVLKELETIGLTPDIMTGTSMGAIITALYAAGLSVNQITGFMHQMSLTNLFRPNSSGASIASNRKLKALLTKSIGRPRFSDLAFPVAFVAVNLRTRKSVILNEGDVISAVLASSALPIILPPVERHGMILIDGGIINNVPFDIAREMGATTTIAVDLSNSTPYGETLDFTHVRGLFGRGMATVASLNLLQIGLAVIDTSVEQGLKALLTENPPDLLLRPNLGTVGILDFHRLEEGIVAGRKIVRAYLPQIEELMAQHKNVPTDAPTSPNSIQSKTTPTH